MSLPAGSKAAQSVIFPPLYCFSWDVVKVWGIPLAWDAPRPDRGKVSKQVQPDLLEGGKLNMTSDRGLKWIDRVWYNAIYYIGYLYNPKGVNNDNNQCKLSLQRWYRGQSTIGRQFAFVVLFCRQLSFCDPVERILVAWTEWGSLKEWRLLE